MKKRDGLMVGAGLGLMLTVWAGCAAEPGEPGGAGEAGAAPTAEPSAPEEALRRTQDPDASDDPVKERLP